jgi:hypothetical protein
MYEKWLPEIEVCPIFDNLSRDEILAVLNELKPEVAHFQKDEAFLIKDQPKRGFGVFLNTVPPQGPRRRNEQWRYPGPFTPGWIFAELPGFSDAPVNFFTSPAPEECYILFIDADRFVGYCRENDPKHQLVIRNQYGVFARKCIALKRARRFFVLGDLNENLAIFLCDQKKETASDRFVPDRDPEELAEMMMIEEDRVQAAYRDLEDKGLIKREEGGFVRILNEAGLKAAAGPRLLLKQGH